MHTPVPTGQVLVPPVVDLLPIGDEIEVYVDIDLDDEVDVGDDVDLDNEVDVGDNPGIDDVDDADDDDVEEFMEEDQDVPPMPPSPVISDITYESDTSEALEHAMITEVTSIEVVPTKLASTKKLESRHEFSVLHLQCLGPS